MNHSKAKIHVLYLPRWYPHRYDPMPGLFIERHGIAASTHCRITVLYVHQDNETKKKGYEIIRSNTNLPEIRIYYPRTNTRIKVLDQVINGYKFYKAHKIGIKLITKEHGKPDLIHVHVLTRHGIIALLNKTLKGIPYLITEHWTRYLPSTNTYYGWLRKKITNIIAHKASAIMPVTKNLSDAMINCGLKNNNYIVIPNVVDIDMFHPTDKEAGSSVGRIIHVSCFDDQQKNISGILRVLKRLTDDRSDFICDMIGVGIDYQNLIKYSSELGISDDKVNFYGLKEGEELADLMKKADFMIMFSNYENLPVVILESYACGVPVISTDVGGIKEHLDNNLGIMIEANDEEALYQNICKLLDKKKKYDKKYLREYAENHFSNKVIGNQLYQAYQDVLKKK